MRNATLGITLLATLALAACGGGGSTPRAGDTGAEGSSEVVARFGSKKITLADLNRQLENQPLTRARLTDPQRKKDFLNNVIRFELLAQEAERRGLDKDPEVLEAMRRVMVQKLTQQQFNDLQISITEEDARAYYEANIHDFVKPERVRLSHVFFSAPKGDPSRNRIRAEAERALAELRGKDRDAFSELARKRSDDERSKRAGGDLSFRTRDELKEMWGEEFANAAFALKTVGQFADLVVTDKGFHVVKLLGRQEGVERTFEQVRAQIESRLQREKKTQAFEEFVQQLWDRANPQIDEAVLEKLEVGKQPVEIFSLDNAPTPSIGKPPAQPVRTE